MLKGACTFIMIKKKLFADSFCCWKGYRMTGKIALIPGDGIGPEIVAEAKKVLDTVAKKYGHEFEYETLLMGGCSIDAYGEPLTEE